MNEKIKTACFTGHRYKSFHFKTDEAHEDCLKIKQLMKEQIINLRENYKVIQYISGMALAVDQWAAEIVLELKEDNPFITLHCALPSEHQTNGWTEKQQDRYFKILRKCDKETWVQDDYTPDCFMKRNKFMVDNSDFVLAVWNGQKSGGTYQTISYAKKLRKKIIIIDPINFIVIPNLQKIR